MPPTDYKARKALPLYTFLTQYFPDAWLELVKVAVAGNEQHNKGEPLHWAQGKSTDQLNTAMRHQLDHGTGNVYDTADIPLLAQAGLPDEPGTLHLAKAAWRLMAEIQQLCNARREGIPLEALVRGSHEFLESPEPTGLPDPEDYGMEGANAELAEMARVAIDRALAPAGTGPLTPMEFQSQLPERNPPAQPPKGRLLACGCYGACFGHATTAASPVPTAANARGPKDPRGRFLACGCYGACGGITPNCPEYKRPGPVLE